MSRSKRRVRRKKLIKIKILFITSLLFILSLIFISFRNNDHDKVIDTTKTINSVSSNKKPSILTLNVVGDIMAHLPQLKAQYNASSDNYNFDNNFQYVKPILESSDLSIGNLETTLAGSSVPYSSYPTFNTPDSIIDSLLHSGIDIVSTINNHSFDKGDLGVERTLEVCSEKGIDTVGTSFKDRNTHLIKEVNDISLGIVAFSYGEVSNENKYLNGMKISQKNKDNMNVFDMHSVDKAFDSIKGELDKVKSTDIQIVILHWGNEYQRYPSEFQKNLAQELSDYGVEVIVGSHPHVVQPVEIIQSKDKLTNTLVIYSLGNFISNQRQELLGTPYTEDGLIVSIKISKDYNSNKTKITSVECIPTWVNKYRKSNKDVFEIIPIYSKEQLLNITNIPMDRLNFSYESTISQIQTSDLIKVPTNIFE